MQLSCIPLALRGAAWRMTIGGRPISSLTIPCTASSRRCTSCERVSAARSARRHTYVYRGMEPSYGCFCLLQHVFNLVRQAVVQCGAVQTVMVYKFGDRSHPWSLAAVLEWYTRRRRSMRLNVTLMTREGVMGPRPRGCLCLA